MADDFKDRPQGDDGPAAEPDSPLFHDLPEEPAAEDAEPAPAAEPLQEQEVEASAPAVEPEAAEPAAAPLFADDLDAELPAAESGEAAAAEDAAERARRSRMRWYVLHANTGHENKVKRNIEMAIKSNHMEDHFGEVLVATQEVTEMKNGKRATVKRKFFPSYILIEMEMTKETFHFINSIPGVTRFVGGTEQRPQPINQDEVDRILGRMSKTPEAKTVLEIPYEIGDSVQVVDGPFTDWIGVINEINHDKGKLKVMISIFGSETPVELDFLQVKAV